MQHSHLFMPLALVSAMAAVQQVHAADEFIARDIRVDGLVRLTQSNVLALLPINSGDRINDPAIADAIRALYASNSFDDIQATKENDVLVQSDYNIKSKGALNPQTPLPSQPLKNPSAMNTNSQAIKSKKDN